jgi:hypothetical protein
MWGFPFLIAVEGIMIRPIREILADRRGLAPSGSAKAESFDK